MVIQNFLFCKHKHWSFLYINKNIHYLYMSTWTFFICLCKYFGIISQAVIICCLLLSTMQWMLFFIGYVRLKKCATLGKVRFVLNFVINILKIENKNKSLQSFSHLFPVWQSLKCTKIARHTILGFCIINVQRYKITLHLLKSYNESRDDKVIQIASYKIHLLHFEIMKGM